VTNYFVTTGCKIEDEVNFSCIVLYCIYPILMGKRRWQCALDASGIYTKIKVFSSQKLVTVPNINLSGIAPHQIW